MVVVFPPIIAVFNQLPLGTIALFCAWSYLVGCGDGGLLALQTAPQRDVPKCSAK